MFWLTPHHRGGSKLNVCMPFSTRRGDGCYLHAGPLLIDVRPGFWYVVPPFTRALTELGEAICTLAHHPDPIRRRAANFGTGKY